MLVTAQGMGSISPHQIREVLGRNDELKKDNAVSGPAHSAFPETGSSSSALAGYSDCAAGPRAPGGRCAQRRAISPNYPRVDQPQCRRALLRSEQGTHAGFPWASLCRTRRPRPCSAELRGVTVTSPGDSTLPSQVPPTPPSSWVLPPQAPAARLTPPLPCPAPA